MGQLGINAWGAYNPRILEGLGVENALSAFVQSIAFHFYSIVAVCMVLVVILWDINFGPMKKAEERTQGGELYGRTRCR